MIQSIKNILSDLDDKFVFVQDNFPMYFSCMYGALIFNGAVIICTFL